MNNKKELKNLYKEMDLPMGIYCLLNKSTGKKFIAASKNLNAAKNSIIFQLKNGSYPVENLQKDWQLFGESDFEFSVLELLKKDEEKNTDLELKALLQLVLAEHQDSGGYNF